MERRDCSRPEGRWHIKEELEEEYLISELQGCKTLWLKSNNQNNSDHDTRSNYSRNNDLFDNLWQH